MQLPKGGRGRGPPSSRGRVPGNEMAARQTRGRNLVKCGRSPNTRPFRVFFVSTVSERAIVVVPRSLLFDPFPAVGLVHSDLDDCIWRCRPFILGWCVCGTPTVCVALGLGTKSSLSRCPCSCLLFVILLTDKQLWNVKLTFCCGFNRDRGDKM